MGFSFLNEWLKVTLQVKSFHIPNSKPQHEQITIVSW